MVDAEVRQWRLPDGRVLVEMDQEFDVCSPDIDPTMVRPRQSAPAVLRGGYSGTDLKLAAAQYFLRMLERDALVEPLVIFHFDAFLSAARSVTWVLQKECARLRGFEAWYAQVRERLKNDQLAKRFVKYRNDSEKEGPHRPLVTYTNEQRYYLDGHITRTPPRPTITLAGSSIDVLEDCRRFLATLRLVVEEARNLGFPQGIEGGPTEFGLHLLRERPDGSWVPFDPPDSDPKPNEFASPQAYAKWKRGRTRFVQSLPLADA